MTDSLKCIIWAQEMAQQLRAYAVLAERGLEFISKSHVNHSQIHITPASVDPMPLALQALVHTHAQRH